ncbi:MAG: flagellar biosynthetic protein FliR [Pikeienuella sp.]
MEPLAEIFALAEAYILTAAGVFARTAAMVFLLPGFGERAIPGRVKLGAALAITVLLAPLLVPLRPETPSSLPSLALMLAAEAVAGLTIGLGFRLLIMALQITGTAAAYHLSLSHVFGTPVNDGPEPTLATFLALGGVVVAMAAGLHIEVVAALARLYEPLPFGRFPDPADLAELSVERAGAIFALGIGLALPFIIISFLYNLALGALSRAMPQLMVVLIGVPLLISLGLFTLYVALPAIFDRWLAALANLFADPLGALD